jgi:hypothetical protein
MRPTNTVNNEQQGDRGISVITPLPTGEGMGEGPVVAGFGPLVAVGGAALFGCGWSTRLVVVGPFVFKKVMACTTKVQATYNPFRVLMERRGLPPALFNATKIAIILCSTNDLSIFFYFICPQSSCSSYYINEKLLLPLMRTWL